MREALILNFKKDLCAQFLTEIEMNSLGIMICSRHYVFTQYNQLMDYYWQVPVHLYLVENSQMASDL
jgi:hypothetical protein